jgi:hypothetical protein
LNYVDYISQNLHSEKDIKKQFVWYAQRSNKNRISYMFISFSNFLLYKSLNSNNISLTDTCSSFYSLVIFYNTYLLYYLILISFYILKVIKVTMVLFFFIDIYYFFHIWRYIIIYCIIYIFCGIFYIIICCLMYYRPKYHLYYSLLY